MISNRAITFVVFRTAGYFHLPFRAWMVVGGVSGQCKSFENALARLGEGCISWMFRLRPFLLRRSAFAQHDSGMVGSHIWVAYRNVETISAFVEIISAFNEEDQNPRHRRGVFSLMTSFT
jgi:hypothetical protein